MQKSCENCSKQFYVRPSRFEKTKFCSRKCFSEDLKGKYTGSKNPNYKGRIHTCMTCNLNYKPYNKVSKFCSHKCASIYRIGKGKVISKEGLDKLREGIKRREEKRVRKKYYCECGNEKNRKNIRCKECKAKKYEHLNKSCIICGNEFRAKTYSKKICSKACYLKYRRDQSTGDRNPNWKGGKAIGTQNDRGNKPHKEWRAKVFERDDYTCQKCGQYGGKLQAHHIKLWSKYPKLRYVLSNGLTLCIPCHKDEHKKAH